MADGNSTAAIRLSSSHRRLKVESAVDSISALPDVILQHILSFVPTELAIGTSLLSTRWRHVWCGTPSLSLCGNTLTADSINETLTRYTAQKMTDFHLKIITKKTIGHMHIWIKFAMSHNVENLSLDINSGGFMNDDECNFPDFFYINSSVNQLSIKSTYLCNITPICSVSWTSLKKLSLSSCGLSDESMDKLISGCPFLESLSLCWCNKFKVLDLTKSLRLRALEVKISCVTEIVAPHTHCLILRSALSCTLVDAASLTESKLDIFFFSTNSNFKLDFFQAMVLKMLGNLQNVEKLTFGGNFLQVLSLAEVLGVPFPKFKNEHLDKYLNLQGLYLNLQGLNADQCWRSKDGVAWNKSRWDVEVKHVVSLVELVFKNTKTLDKLVVQLNERYFRHIFEDLVTTFSHNNNVFISLSPDTPDAW
ncbi:unnamed protein product [Microthlaspi erraticum]|uniref:Uncharacterized protein n=1 Tax=Microthlaspi erraticum TaxID=1685480 RepID=A0A6D2KE46_9BRAS|nr:unnamed protein product [Microthlaspi erraticum]